MELKDMETRDMLAYERTKMASERTVLAYFRTFIGMEGAAAALIKFFTEYPFLKVIAYILTVTAPILLVFGLVHSRHEMANIDALVFQEEAETLPAGNGKI